MKNLGLLLSLFMMSTEVQDTWPEYKLVRQDEDFSYLKDPAKKTDYLDGLNYIPLNDDKTSYLTLGGVVRERYEYFSNFFLGAT